MAWLCETVVPGSHPDDFMAVEGRWRSLDTKLLAVLKGVYKGTLQMRLATAMDRAQKDGRLLSGRTALCMVNKMFEPNGRAHNTNAITDLYDLRCHPLTMAGVEHYLSAIDSLWLQCVELPSSDVMTN
eukprot:6335870-Heterocapsa_arctica.AAC.1